MRRTLMRSSSSRRLKEVPRCARMAMALNVLKYLVLRLEAPAGWCDEMAKYPNPTNHLRPAEGGAFPLPSCGRAPSAPMPHRKICELMRHPAKCRHSHHGGRRSVDLGTNRPSVCGVTFGGRAFGASNFCASAARGSLAEPLVDGLSNCCGLTGKRALDQPRSRSSGTRGDAVAVSCNAGCAADRTSAKSKPASLGISKSGASFFATDVLTASANALSGRSRAP